MSGYVITEETPYSDPHSRGTGSIVTERKGYVLRTRGEHNRMVRHDYRCPVHGVFEAMVPSGDVPDAMPCVEREYAGGCSGVMPGPGEIEFTCSLPSPWQYPTVAQGFSAGSVKT